MSEIPPKDDNSEHALSELLDDALKDFEDPGQTTPALQEIPEVPPPSASDNFLKESLEETMKSFMNSDQAELAASLQELMLSDAGSDVQAVIQESLRSLSEAQQNLPEGSDMSCLFPNMGLPDDGMNFNVEDDMLPMLMQFMQPLLSKEVLYPTIKDLCDKYPKWLEEHEATCDKEELDKNTKIFGYMKEVRDHLETHADTDDEVTKTRKFKELMELLKKMQECGQPPKELLGDEDERPMPDMSQCNIM